MNQRTAVERGIAGALLALAARAASAGYEPQPPVFGETVEVRVVNLEVVVTDRDGLPVTGLGAGDFELTVDGEKLPIRYFSEVRGGVAVAAESAPKPGIDDVPSLAPGEPVGTSYLVFVDDYFPLAHDRDRVLDALRDDLGRLGPEDRMAIVAFDGTRLTMLSSWTGSERELEKAIRQAKLRPAKGLQRRTEQRSLGNDNFAARGLPGIDASRVANLDTRLDVNERFYASVLERQVSNAVSAASAALRSFANPPGRKVMLLLAGGWPYDIGEYVSKRFGRIVSEPGVLRGKQMFAPLIDTADQVGYTLFPVDVPGLAPSALGDSELDAPSDETEQFASFLRENNQQYALEHLALSTGGRALLNANRLKALEGAAAGTRAYYWIGFAPTWKGDDGRHSVKVDVLRLGLKVRSRKGYVDFSRRSEVSAEVESELLFGSSPGSRPLALELGRPERAHAGTMRLPMTLAVPTSELTFLPSGDDQVAQLELRIGAIDDHGGRSDIPVVPVQLSLGAKPDPGSVARYETTIELRRTRNRVTIALYDPVTGALWTKTVDVAP